MCGKTRVDVREYETGDGGVFWDVPRRRLVNSYLRKLESSCLVVSVTIAFIIIIVIIVAEFRIYRIFVIFKQMAHIWNTQSCCRFKELGIFLKTRYLPLVGTYKVECLGPKMTCCVPQLDEQTTKARSINTNNHDPNLRRGLFVAMRRIRRL